MCHCKFGFTRTIPWHTDAEGVWCHVDLRWNGGFINRGCFVQKKLTTTRSSIRAAHRLITWRARERMDAAYKRINGSYGQETEERGTGVNYDMLSYLQLTLFAFPGTNNNNFSVIICQDHFKQKKQCLFLMQQQWQSESKLEYSRYNSRTKQSGFNRKQLMWLKNTQYTFFLK